jgi:hypothetical protein
MLRGAIEIFRSNPTLGKEIPEPPSPAAAESASQPTGADAAAADAESAVAK